MTSDIPANANSTESRAGGTIVVLVDESPSMAQPVAGGTKSKSESVATAVNSMLKQLADGPAARVAIVGYGDCGDGAAARLRWAGPLEGRRFVDSTELAGNAVTVEDRVRRIPGTGGVMAREETVRFPIWYVAETLEPGSFPLAAEFVRGLLAEAPVEGSGKPALVLHICGEPPSGNGPEAPSTGLSPGATLWCHLQLGSSDRVPPVLYPATCQHLVDERATALFESSSVLPDALLESLRKAQVSVAPGARGVGFQAGMADLIRFLALAKAYVAAAMESFAAAMPDAGSSAPSTPTGSEPADDLAPSGLGAAEAIYDRATLVLLADRTQAEPSSDVWGRRQEHVNEVLGQIAKRASGDLEVILITYGESVDAGFADGAGKEPVADLELSECAIRVDETHEKVSNGIGGLIEVKRARPVFVDCEPSPGVADLQQAVTVAIETIRHAQDRHAGRAVLPVVLHVTSGAFSVEAIEAAGARFAQLGEVLVYHCVLPETPLPTMAYPADASRLEDPCLAALWRISSPLAGAETIGKRRRTIVAGSRGLVVGCRFDLLLESLDNALNFEPG